MAATPKPIRKIMKSMVHGGKKTTKSFSEEDQRNSKEKEKMYGKEKIKKAYKKSAEGHAEAKKDPEKRFFEVHPKKITPTKKK